MLLVTQQYRNTHADFLLLHNNLTWMKKGVHSDSEDNSEQMKLMLISKHRGNEFNYEIISKQIWKILMLKLRVFSKKSFASLS